MKNIYKFAIIKNISSRRKNVSRKEKRKLEEKKEHNREEQRKIKKSKNRNKNKYRNADRTQKPRIDNDISEIAVTIDKNPK